jgi:hypothetical protein
MKKWIKNNKVLFILLLLSVLLFILGFCFHAVQDEESKKTISNNVIKELMNPSDLKSILLTNSLLFLTIWLLGISIVGVIIIVIIYSFKVFIFSFELCSYLITLKMNNILGIILLYIPIVILLFLLFLQTFYSIHYSISLFRYLFLKKKCNILLITKRYLKLLLPILSINLICSLLEYYLYLRHFLIKI